MHAIIVIFFGWYFIGSSLLLIINRRERPIINLQFVTYNFIMLLHDDSCRSKWCRLCEQATVILTKYESNVFFVF